MNRNRALFQGSTKMKRQFKLLSFLLFLLFINTSFAWAERLPIWEVHVGLMGAILPHYRGSDSNSTPVFPFPSVIYRGERLKAENGKVQEGAKGDGSEWH